MHILFCPDSFKDALSAEDAAHAMARGAVRADPHCHSLICPLADGGEGSLDALIAATGAERRQQTVQDALGRPCEAAWGWLADQRTAFIELAEASGLQALADHERDARYTSTYGVGQLFLAALDHGADKALLYSAVAPPTMAARGCFTPWAPSCWTLGASHYRLAGQRLPTWRRFAWRASTHGWRA